MLRNVLTPLIISASVAPLAGGCAPTGDGSADELVSDEAALVHQRLKRQDYDGDGKSDHVIFRPSSGTWFVKRSAGGADLVRQFGASTDKLLPGDYDGDGKTDFAIARPDEHKLYATRSSGGPDIVRPVLVNSSWQPYLCETNGDAKADSCSVHCGTDPANPCLFWISEGDGVNIRAEYFGLGAPEVAVPEDYDGDGLTDLATFQTSTGRWKIKRSLDGFEQTIQFGESTDRLVPGDYDGDGKADIALFRPRTNRWHVHPSSGGADRVIDMGIASDRLVPSDYDGDRKADAAVVRAPSAATWFVRPSAGGADRVTPFGESSDIIPYSK